MMNDKDKTVPLREAMEQVGVVGARLALMHLAYARILVGELGEVKGKEAVVRAMMEYGRLVGERNKSGKQDLPYYGFHDKYIYKDESFVDMREKPAPGEEMDLSQYKVEGCILSKVFRELGEKELGCLYCYVDAAKSMAADSGQKLIHTACEVLDDGYCGFNVLPTTDKERRDFEEMNIEWKETDPILDRGSGLKKG